MAYNLPLNHRVIDVYEYNGQDVLSEIQSSPVPSRMKLMDISGYKKSKLKALRKGF